MGWYHWECVQVMEEPAGTWLCPTCSPNAAFYLKQLAKGPAAQPPGPKSEKATTKVSSKKSVPGQKPKESRTKAKEPAPRPKQFGNPPGSEAQAKRGTALKKPAPEKPKPKWVGWLELPSDEEEEFKKQVDAQWSVQDELDGKRTRASKAVAEANETGRRTRGASLRAGRKRRVVESSSDEEEGGDVEGDNVYQENETKEEEADSADEEENVGGDIVHREKEEQEEGLVSGEESVFEGFSDEKTSGSEKDSMDEEEDSLKDQESASQGDREDSNESMDEEEDSPEDDSSNGQESTSQEDREDSMDVDIEFDTEKADENSTGSSSVVFFDAEEEITAPSARANEHSDSELSDLPNDTEEVNPGSEVQTPPHPTVPTPTPSPLTPHTVPTPTPSPLTPRDVPTPTPSPITPPRDLVITAAPQGDTSPESNPSEDMDVDEATGNDDLLIRYQLREYVWAGYPESAIRSTLPRLA